MKQYHSIIIFMLIVCSATVSGIHNYKCTEHDIIQDMNQALAKTLSEKQEEWITPDTIQDYHTHLKIAALRDCSYIYYSMDDKSQALCSKKMRWHSKQKTMDFQGYANCSFASIFGMSDQRLPMSLSLMATIWLIFSIGYFRKRHNSITIFGTMIMDNATRNFYTSNNKPINLTPMQQQLMTMFFSSEEHKLSKQEICNTLWPKKPDASETLYTLIRRLKPIVEKHGNLKIISDRGKDYQLKRL